MMATLRTPEAAYSCLIYGETGSAKTSQARHLAEYLWETSKKRTRMISNDTGSGFGPVADLVEAGIIIPLLLPPDPRFNPRAALKKLSRGEWPKGGALLPSVAAGTGSATRWTNPNVWESWGAASASEIGGYFIDSLTSLGMTLLGDSVEKNLTVSGTAIPGYRQEDGETFGSSTMQHYGDGQRSITDAIKGFETIPGLEMVIFTALASKGEDAEGATSRAILGPDTVGNKLHGKIPAMVTDTIHLVRLAGNEGIRMELTEQPDSQVAKMLWHSKVRLLSIPEIMLEFRKAYPTGFAKLTEEKGIREVWEFKSRVNEIAKQRIGKLLE